MAVPASRLSPTLADFRPGDTFANRIELSLSGMHRPRRAGIGGTLADGAESIVLSGSYEDDVDLGKTVWYAGHGGHDIKTGRQVAHQALDRYNAALTRSYEMGKHIRLIRGAKLQNEFASATGYRYEGLYRIESVEWVRGKSGFWIWQFKLIQNSL
jgi:putative restriction endonuclease